MPDGRYQSYRWKAGYSYSKPLSGAQKEEQKESSDSWARVKIRPLPVPRDKKGSTSIWCSPLKDLPFWNTHKPKGVPFEILDYIAEATFTFEEKENKWASNIHAGAPFYNLLASAKLPPTLNTYVGAYPSWTYE